jgi:hypothetical protein
MKKCPHSGEALGLELRDFDLRTAIENALILVRNGPAARALPPLRGHRCRVPRDSGYLRLGGERRKCETGSENDPDQPHEHLGRDGWRGL